MGSGRCGGRDRSPARRAEDPITLWGRMAQPAEAARTVIMTVDDDPGVSRAVARDLRRRYGASYRIVRAESGESALEALRELKLRGDLVAVILADYRMPQMNGIEFLERAMDVHPEARRVLLTAYADTGAAIDAINVVDLDHYLLKPWDPPEEKLYPVVDDLLEAWKRSDHRPVPSTKVVGHRWSARSSDVREFLARNQVPYRWYSSDEPEGRRLLAAAGEDGMRLPLVVTPDGTPLVEPDPADLASHVGLATRPAADFYDLVVIGGGPAGLGAAVYGASEGLRTVLVERSATGGQAGQSSRIENYLGFPTGCRGAAHRAGAAAGHSVRRGDPHRAGGDRPGGGRLGPGGAVLRRVAGRRTQRDPGDRGVVPAARRAGLRRTGRLRRLLRLVAHRGARLSGPGRVHRGRRQLGRAGGDVPVPVRQVGDAAGARPGPVRVDVVLPDRADRPGAEHLGTVRHGRRGGARRRSSERLTLRDTDSGHTDEVDAQWLFVFIGAAPLTDWLDGTVLRDERGFILAGPDLTADGRPPAGWELDRPPYHLETNVRAGVFVAGDARAESAKRVASAVGEGAMAVMLVHRYLEQS